MNMETKTIKTKYIMYCRKSTEGEDKQIQSLDDQKSENTLIAKRLNLKVLKIYSESKSAKQPGREQFGEMIQLINKRKDIKGIISWELNRLSRNPIDTGALQWLLQEGTIDEIITSSRTYKVEDSALLMSIDGGFANEFIMKLKKDTLRGVNSKLEKGIAPILAPAGYMNDLTKRQGERDIIPHPTNFPLMRRLFEIAMTGNFSLESLAHKAKELGITNNRGNRYICKSQMADILRNPFYIGKFLYNGKVYQGIHEPMLSQDEYDLIQEIMSGKSRPRKEVHNFPLTGLIRCGGCGSMITAETHTKPYKNGKFGTFTYYRCTKKTNKKCKQPYLRDSEMESQVIEYLNSIKISQKFVDWAIKWINIANSSRKELEKSHRLALKRQYEGVCRKIDNLLELRISEANIGGRLLSDEEFQSKKAILLEDKARINDQMANFDQRYDEWIDLTAQTFNFASTAQDKFEHGSPETKKLILKAIGSHLALKDRKLSVEVRKPFTFIQEVIGKYSIDQNWLAPTIIANNTAKRGDSSYQNELLGGRRGSNPQHPAPQAGALPLSYDHQVTLNNPCIVSNCCIIYPGCQKPTSQEKGWWLRRLGTLPNRKLNRRLKKL